VIIRGELEETHKKRLASLDRPAHVHVIPLGSMTAEGVRRFRDFAKIFKRHRFYLALRAEEQTSTVLEVFKGLKAPNVHTWLMEGGISGTEISRWHTRMEKRSTADPKVES
jgi:hypothetical protein